MERAELAVQTYAFLNSTRQSELNGTNFMKIWPSIRKSIFQATIKPKIRCLFRIGLSILRMKLLVWNMKQGILSSRSKSVPNIILILFSHCWEISLWNVSLLLWTPCSTKITEQNYCKPRNIRHNLISSPTGLPPIHRDLFLLHGQLSFFDCIACA